MKDKRIALVKQNVYQDLYVINSKDPKEIIESSLRRCGPVGLIVDCGADFYIVNVEKDKECNFWQQKSTDCGQEPISYYLNFANQKLEVNGDLVSQKELSFDISEINWNNYDIVISLDVSFPSHFTTKYIKTLWCYMPGEPCMSVYKKSRFKILNGYDVFLNQEIPYYPFTFRNWISIPFYKSLNLPYFTRKKWKARKQKQLDFPYSLTKCDSIEKLYFSQNKKSSKKGIAFEFYTFQSINQKFLNSIETKHEIVSSATSKVVEKRLFHLSNTKYFITDATHYKRGNGLLEAMASGCLCLATKNQYLGNYQRLMGKLGQFKSLGSIIDYIDYLEDNHDEFLELKKLQDKMVDYHCYELPLKRLHKLHNFKIVESAH